MDPKEIILHTVCDILQVNESDVLKANTIRGARKAELVHARHLCVCFAVRHKAGTQRAIGQYYGGRDHCTVIYAMKSIQNDIDTNPAKRFIYDQIAYRLNDLLSGVECYQYDMSYDYPGEEISEINLNYQKPCFTQF